MPILIIFISLMGTLAAYFMVARRDGSWVNVLTPIYLTFVPAYYLLELLNIHYFGYSGSTMAYTLCYVTYAINFIVLAWVYSRIKVPRVRLPFNTPFRIRWLPYIVLSLSVVVYLPILFEFSELLMHPRQIYVQTRSGYGHMFFVSTALTFLAFILMLFKKRSFVGEKVLFFLVCFLLCLMHGSKGQVVQLIFMAMMYRVYVRGLRVQLRGALLIVGAFAIVMSGLFALLRSSSGDPGDSLAMVLASYSDYNRNAMMLIDDEPELHYGRLTLQQNIYTRVPRVLFPDKPKNWGTFYLAQKYYPVWFEKETGAPSFGILGVPYADFGYLAVFYLLAWAAVTGLMLRLFVNRVSRNGNPSDFVMVLFLCSVSVIPGGMGYLLIDHLILAAMLAVVLRLRWSVFGIRQSEKVQVGLSPEAAGG